LSPGSCAHPKKPRVAEEKHAPSGVKQCRHSAEKSYIVTRERQSRKRAATQ